MKKTIPLLTLFCLLVVAVSAQNDKYLKAMETRVAGIEGSKTTEQWDELANSFERIADAEKNQWLPYYYASLCHVMKGHMISNGLTGGFADKTDPEADRADELLKKAEALSADNSEIWCLRKMIATLRMMADPMNRWQTFGPAAAEALEKAKKLNPDNPRVYLLEGQDKFFTPEQFGGSKAEARILFEESMKKFETQKPETPIHPAWGLSQVKYFYEQAK